MIPSTVYAIDRAAFNQGENAKYDFEITENGVNSTVTARGPSAVCYSIGSDQSGGMLSDNPHSGIYETDVIRTLDGNGTMPLVIIHDIVKQLFDNCVFINIRDMQKTALRECSVFLSYDLFETYLEGVNKNG